MDWLIRRPWAEPNLALWEQRPFSADVEKGPRPHDNRDNHERVIGWEPAGLPTSNGIARRVADAILRFDVFPPHMLTSVLRRTPIEVGDTIGLRYFFLPGIDLFFAARVIDRFEDVVENLWRCGFIYRTLEGHPECGEEVFVVEKDLTSGKVTAALRSWSRPGSWLATLAYPLARRWQLRAGQAALEHLEEMAAAIRDGEGPTASGGRKLLDAADQTGDSRPPLAIRRDLRTGLLRSDTRW